MNLFYSGKDDHTRIEAELREYQRKMDSMARDLTNKDHLNKQLKAKINSLEDEFETCRQEYSDCVVSRDSLQQQKLDVERELKVISQNPNILFRKLYRMTR